VRMRRLAIGLALLVGGAGPEPPQAAVSVREDGTVLVGGEAFFPLGLVHVSSAGDRARRSGDLQMIAVGGFNVMQAVLQPGDKDFLDEAEGLGIRVLAEAADTEGLKAAVKELKGKGAILAWNLAEDADNGRRFPAELARLNREIKALDPGHPTYLTCGDLEHCGKFLELSDLVGLKSLPLPSGNLGGPADLFRAAERAAGEGRRGFLAVIQAWAPKGKPAPSPEEVRNMTYQALVHGARGILFHAYFDRDWDLGTQTELWNEIRVIASEIQSLRPALLEGKRQRLETKASDVHAAAWPHKGRIYLAAVNVFPEPRKVMIRLPAEAAGAGRPQFRIPPRKLALEGSVLVGEMGAREVQVLLFESR